VNEMEFNAKLAEIINGHGANYVSFETGNYQLDFKGQVLDSTIMTGLDSSTAHLEKGITGTMSVNAIFGDDSLLSVETFKFASGAYGNGPTPNNDYSISFGETGKQDGKDIWMPRTPEPGMRLPSGAQSWKLRLPNFNGSFDMLLHSDALPLGTKGCIGLRGSEQALFKLGKSFENYIVTQKRTLSVRFQIPNNPNYGNEGRSTNVNQ
jgi:hypothetical protein